MPNGFLLTGEAVKKLREDHATIKNRVRRLESMVSNIRPSMGKEDSVLVKVTEQIEPRVTTTLGKGKADVQEITIDDSDVATFKDATEVKSYGADPTNRNIDVYNDSLIPIPVDSYIRVSRNYLSGAWMPTNGVQTAIAKTVGSIAARTGTTAGSGTVNIYYMTAAGVLTDTGKTVTAYNIAGGAIQATTFITIKRMEAAPYWVVDMEDCG